MGNRFLTTDYLKSGNHKQKLAHKVLDRHGIMKKLEPFDPILVGTIPIGIDISNSDLDIICYTNDLLKFKQTIEGLYRKEKDYKIWERKAESGNAVVANFILDNFVIEIFGQSVPTIEQNAYRHMLIENKLLKKNGEDFRQKIIELKQQGYKTEPAFGILLELKGDPYKALLDLQV